MYIKDNIIINIYLQSSDKISFKNIKNKINYILKIYNIKNYNIINLPKKKHKYTILRSPHIYKKSLESYEEIIYTSNYRFTITNKSNYTTIFYIIKFLKYNIPLNTNITFKLENDVKKNIL